MSVDYDLLITARAEQLPDGSWRAVDTNRYDGAVDAGPQDEGYGATKDEALADLLIQIAERMQ